MKNFTINISGKTEGDIESALHEVARLIKKGYLAGTDWNEDGEFMFESKGEFEGEEDEV